MNDGMNSPRFSRIELKVQGTARRKANHQLLCVPWGRFRRAYDEYPRWQALALWGEEVLGTRPPGQSSLLATLNKHCPDFVVGRSRLRQCDPLALNLLEWVHTHRFGYAKQPGSGAVQNNLPIRLHGYLSRVKRGHGKRTLDETVCLNSEQALRVWHVSKPECHGVQIEGDCIRAVLRSCPRGANFRAF